MNTKQRFKLGAGAGLVTMLLGALMVLAPGAGADHLGPVPEDAVLLPEGGGPVPICHATSAETNPYILNTPNVSATGEFFGSNHASHTGPVFEPGMKSAKPKVVWGDIIPPIAVDGHLVFAGSQNWLEGGSEQYAECSAVGEPAAPVVIVEKDVPGEADDTTDFSFTVDQGGEEVGAEDIADGEFFETTVAAGALSITEVESSGYSLTDVTCERDYTANGVLVEGEALADSLDGTTATITAAAGDIITCVFTNTADTYGITVAKTNDANDDGTFGESEQAPAAGSEVPFRIVLSNTGNQDLSVATLTDTWAGLETPIDLLELDGLTCTRGEAAADLADPLPAGSVTTCNFTLTGYAPAAGASKVNTVAVTMDEEDVDDSDDSTVTTPQGQTPPPTPTPTPSFNYGVVVEKLNDADDDGVFSDTETAESEDASVEFQITIRNTGSGALILESLEDRVFGVETIDLLEDGLLDCGTVELGVGSVLAAGAVVTCTFELDEYAPAPGTSQTNTVTVETNEATASDTSRVEVEPIEVLPAPPVTPPGPPEETPPAVTPPVKTPAVQPAAEVKGVQTVRTLPRTGDETRGLAGVGAFMLALGAAMVIGSRRQLARR